MQRVLNDMSLQEKGQTNSGLMMSRRGSTLQHLARDSQNRILTIGGHDAESVEVCEIFCREYWSQPVAELQQFN